MLFPGFAGTVLRGTLAVFTVAVMPAGAVVMAFVTVAVPVIGSTGDGQQTGG